MPIAGLDRAAIQSLAYARSISPHVTAVHVATDLEDAHGVHVAWQEWQKQLSKIVLSFTFMLTEDNPPSSEHVC